MSLATRHYPLITVVAFLAGLLVACGVPGEPLPPLLEIPQPVADLAAEQIGARVRLVFSRPQLTTEGTRVRFLDRIEMHGSFLAAENPLSSFPEQAQLLATINAAALPEGLTQIVYELPIEGSQRGAAARFAVKAINHRGRDAGFSNVATIEIADLPEPPAGLETTLTEEAIRLSWKESEQSAFGGPAPRPDGYEVYRAEAGSALPDAPPSTIVQSTAAPFYEDRSFRFGRRYVYSVLAFVRRGDSRAVTPHSDTVAVDAIDRFPPASPQNVRAVAVPGAVELAWSPNAESELAGYNVYRSEGGAPAKLNAELLPIPLFRDSTVKAGTEYRYQVKAVDQEGNEGAASEEATATAE